jgi:hypothetical protein
LSQCFASIGIVPMPEEDPEIQARINRWAEQYFENYEYNLAIFETELLPLIGMMSIEFNRLEGDFKYLLILLRDDLPLPLARKTALKIKNFKQLLSEVEEWFPKKITDPAIVEQFQAIAAEVEELAKERNLMIHSVWIASSDPDKPFVRLKEDETDPEVYFDVPTVEKLVERLTEFRNRAYDFFCDEIPGFARLPATLHDSKPPGA